jgi:flagellar basal-body rod protein FlgG
MPGGGRCFRRDGKELWMSGEIYMAAAGALACEKRLEILANNLSNVGTTGYKKDTAYFETYLPEDGQIPEIDPRDLESSQAEIFWSKYYMVTDHSGGPLRQTENSFDLAITGDGFFCVQTPEGVRYTRSGDFTLDSQGVMVTKDGWPVLGEGGTMMVDSQGGSADPRRSQFTVDERGGVYVDGTQIDRLRIADFEDRHRLMKAGANLFAPVDDAVVERPADNYRVSQGYLELSNVDAVQMMTELIEVLRGYESYQKVIQSIDETNSQAINEVGASG